jgi:anti-sigma factor RsiW
MTCQDIQPLLAAHVDGCAADAERQRVELHLRGCGECRRAVEVQRAVRQALASHGRTAAAPAPPGLATRIAATLAAEQPALLAPGWHFRLTAFAAASLVVLALGAVAIPLMTGRSTVVLAAQMALDHLKCFLIEPHDHGEAVSVEEAERELKLEHGIDLALPRTAGLADSRLVALRRCLYGEGFATHLLYTVENRPVSLFIFSGVERAAADVAVLGQDEVSWSRDGRTYLLVGASTVRHRLHEMASYLRDGAQ